MPNSVAMHNRVKSIGQSNITISGISEQNDSKTSTFMPTPERLKRPRKFGANGQSPYQDGTMDYDELMNRLKN